MHINQHALRRACFRRWQPSWKRTGQRLTAVMLRHFENTGDPQMLASIACVLGSASRDGGCGEILPQGNGKVETYDRYLTCYAERLYQWGAQGVRAETISHQTEAFCHQHDVQSPTTQSRHGTRHGIVPSLCGRGGDEASTVVRLFVRRNYVQGWLFNGR